MNTPSNVPISTTSALIPSKEIERLQVGEARELGNLYVLYYRTGMNPRPQELYFQRLGTFQEVVAFAKHYCEKLNYRFVIVKKFLSNLEEDLKKFSSD